MASGIYNRFKANLMNKEVDLEGDTLKVMLVSSAHGFTATHTTMGEVSANEVSGDGYDAGGATMEGLSVTEGATTKWDGTDTEWTSATFTAYHAVIYDVTANDNLVCSFDFGEAKEVVSGTFKIEWHADGIITLATAA